MPLLETHKEYHSLIQVGRVPEPNKKPDFWTQNNPKGDNAYMGQRQGWLILLEYLTTLASSSAVV